MSPKKDVDNDTEVSQTIYSNTEEQTQFLHESRLRGQPDKIRQHASRIISSKHCFQFVQCLFEPKQRETVAERERVRDSECSASDRTRFRDNSTVVSVEELMSRRKRELRDMKNLHEFLERQTQLAVFSEIHFQRKLSEAESDMEIKEWERRFSEFALCES